MCEEAKFSFVYCFYFISVTFSWLNIAYTIKGKTSTWYFYINNIINILFIKAKYESHRYIYSKIITQGSNNLNILFVNL